MPKKAFSKIWLLVVVAVVVAAGVLVWWYFQPIPREGNGAFSVIDLGAEDSGRTIKVKSGDLIIITLRNRVSSGPAYGLGPAKFNSQILELQKISSIPPRTDKPGDSGWSEQSFRVLKAEKSKIEIWNTLENQVIFLVNIEPK